MKHTYSINSDTLNAKLAADALEVEITGSAIVTALDYIQVDGDDIEVNFKATLSAGDITILEDLVANHEGTPIQEVLPPQDVVITEVVEAKPFAEPTHRTRRNAIPALVTCAKDSATNVDFTLPEELYATGGSIIIKNSEMGDWIEAEIVDTLGIIPEPYRAALCEDYPIVANYVLKHYIAATDIIVKEEIETYPLNAKISQGLALRIIYHAVDSGIDRVVAVNYHLSRKL